MRVRARPASSMTSLVDVLFVVVFASLVSSVGMVRPTSEEDVPAAPSAAAPSAAAAAPSAAAIPSAAPAPSVSTRPIPKPPPDAARLRERAIESLSRTLGARRAHFVRVSAEGQVTAIESEGADGLERKSVTVPLLARVTDPDVVLEYLGDRSPELRICALMLRELGVDSLERELVIIAPDVPLTDLPLALARGLVADVARCSANQGLAVLVSPEQG